METHNKPIIYLIGSLRNPLVPELANEIESWGFEAFASWFAAGEIADDRWRDYEKKRGSTFKQALNGYAAKHVFEFDKHHLERADAVVLQSPAGKSGFLELGWSLGKGKPGYILLDNPDRWDVMFQFATYVADSPEDLQRKLKVDFRSRLN